MITQTLKNKFDCVVVIEGNRGLGKSTLAIKLARAVSRKFRLMGMKDYRFNWKSSLVYTKKETKNFLHKWRSVGIADEMINVTFNRDFYNEEQKDIIKMLNMNRDHCNFFISCVPQFQNIDNQIKGLCKLRLTVVRRGLAVIQMQNHSIYSSDRWDTAINSKIEKTWLEKGVKHPHYAKLTTFRGMVKFPALSPKAEEKYQQIKDDKRNLVAKEDMGIEEENAKEKDPVIRTAKLLKEGKVRNGTFIDGIAEAMDIAPSTFKAKISRHLRDSGEPHRLTDYYWERKVKKKNSGEISD